MGSLCAKNAIEKFSRLGTFKVHKPINSLADYRVLLIRHAPTAII